MIKNQSVMKAAIAQALSESQRHGGDPSLDCNISACPKAEIALSVAKA